MTRWRHTKDLLHVCWFVEDTRASGSFIIDHGVWNSEDAFVQHLEQCVTNRTSLLLQMGHDVAYYTVPLSWIGRVVCWIMGGRYD